jgi:cytochrome P450
MVAGYQDALSVFTSTAKYSNAVYQDPTGPNVLRGSTTMINADPPEHTPLRREAYQAFRKSSVAKLEETITRVVDSLLDAPSLGEGWAAPGREVDTMEVFARQVPATVIALLPGIPVADIPTFISWSDDLTAAMNSGQQSTPQWPETFARAERAGDAMRDYLQDQIARHRRAGHDDLINDLLAANGAAPSMRPSWSRHASCC